MTVARIREKNATVRDRRYSSSVRFTNLLPGEEGWETKSTTTEFVNNHLSVVTALVKSPSRSEPRPWTIVHRKAAVVVAPITSDGKFLLIKEERVPVRAAIWSMPAGQIDEHDEPDEDEIKAVALRELNEETGYEVAPNGELITLGFFYTSPGLTDEHCYLFVARPVRRAAEHKSEEGEGILEVRAFSAAEMRAMIARNEIRDSNTLSTCARMASRGLFHF